MRVGIDKHKSYANVGYGSVRSVSSTRETGASPWHQQPATRKRRCITTLITARRLQRMPPSRPKRQAAIEAREQALQAKADAVRAKAQFKAEAIRAKAEEKARHKLAKAENRALKIEGIAPAEVERKIRLDVHGRPKPVDARLDSRDCRSPVIGGRHRAYMLGTWRESEVGVCRVHDSVADSVHQFGLLPSGRLEPARHRCAAAYRSCQHLPAHCRHVYPGFVCAGTVLAQCDHHIDVGVHGHRPS